MEPTSAPVTPLGSRTPHAHPGLYTIIGILCAVILLGAWWVFATYDVFPDAQPAPATSASPTGTVSYENAEYGLRILLPNSWAEYGLTSFEWIAFDISSSISQGEIARGPLLHIVHPAVAGGNTRQDIPVMVFTLDQWEQVSGPDANWSVSAAPIAPTELARNRWFVFALPARYNYAFPDGWEEVEELIRNGAVQAF